MLRRLFWSADPDFSFSSNYETPMPFVYASCLKDLADARHQSALTR